MVVWKSFSTRGDPFNDFDAEGPDETHAWETPHGFIDSLSGAALRLAAGDGAAFSYLEAQCAAAEETKRATARRAARAARTWMQSAVRALHGRASVRVAGRAVHGSSPEFADALRGEALHRGMVIARKLH